jgi:hypothetical protein
MASTGQQRNLLTSKISAVVDGDRQYPIPKVAVDESEESRQHLPLLVRCRRMDLGKDDLA